jgi:hypothetical protein
VEGEPGGRFYGVLRGVAEFWGNWRRVELIRTVRRGSQGMIKRGKREKQRLGMAETGRCISSHGGPRPWNAGGGEGGRGGLRVEGER